MAYPITQKTSTTRTAEIPAATTNRPIKETLNISATQKTMTLTRLLL